MSNLPTYQLNQLSQDEVGKLCTRPGIKFDAVMPAVRDIVDAVKSEGDKAVCRYTQRFDGVRLSNFSVSAIEVDAACNRVTSETKQAFQQAADNIRAFHASQLSSRRTVETMPGVICFSESRPIERVGLYIPGGSAPLPSTVMMLAIPAVLAGCKEIVMVTPPDKNGSVPDIILFVSNLCGIKKIYKVGGAQAIAALAYGTGTIPKVDKVFGPGNQYVTAAKMLISIDPDGAALDMPAGPSEVLVIADRYARPDFVAADLLSQAEHGPDSQAVLVCTDMPKAQLILGEIDRQLASLPRRAIAERALQNSMVVIAGSLARAVDFANDFAPEHLILNVANADRLVPEIINAGSVFLGAYSCESAGDYASGTNHSLPTYGYARAYGGVSVASFQKQVTFQRVTKAGAKLIAPVVVRMAEQEGLAAHQRAMDIRTSCNYP